MAKHWYVRQSGNEHGPLSGTSLKQLAAEGKLQPADAVRREDMGKWVKAASVKGLFAPAQATSPPPVPVTAPPPVASAAGSDATEAGKSESFFSQIKSLGTDIFSGAGKASRLAAKQAERTRLTTSTLPSAFTRFGQHIFEQKERLADFPEQFQQAESIESRIAELEREWQQERPAENISDRAKSAATAAKIKTQIESNRLQLKRSFTALGRAAYERDGEASGPPGFVQPTHGNGPGDGLALVEIEWGRIREVGSS